LTDENENSKRMELDALADFHARLDRCETFETALSRRITALEEGTRGHYSDDPMSVMGPMIWVMVGLTVLPLIMDMVTQWRSSRS
jgi:hypothetical protein